MFNGVIEAAPCPVSLEAGREMFCSARLENNTISAEMGTGGTGSRGCVEVEGIGVVGSEVGEEAVGMEAGGCNDIIVTRDEKCSFSQARFSSSESFRN